MNCPVCNSKLILQFELKRNVYKCRLCGLLHSDAQFDHSFKSQIDETKREKGLKTLRYKNFSVIINTLKKFFNNNNILNGLEIGSGNGWWLEVCNLENIVCTGIEPEKIFEDYHKQKGLEVFYNFYPNPAVSVPNGYDFIVFNDVFEHIDAIDELVAAVKKDLSDDGILIINLPVSNGFIYRLSVLLCRVGLPSFVERMWQFNFHSPHINYFNEKNLEMLVGKKGFTKIGAFKLASIDLATVKERISTDKNISNFKAAFLAIAVVAISPFVSLTKPDIMVFFFRKRKN